MAEYIERDAVDNALLLCGYAWNDLPRRIVQQTIAADVVPVVHGFWIGTADGYADGCPVYDRWECSNCGYDADGADEKPTWKYCPNCGAKMDGGENHGQAQ